MKNIKSDVLLFSEICTVCEVKDTDALWAVLNKYNVKKLAGFESIDECISRFLNAKQCEGVSNTTYSNYYFALKTFHSYVGDTAPASIETDQVRSYIIFLKADKKLKATSISQNVAIVKCFFNWLYNEGLIVENPISAIKNVKYEFKDIRQPLTDDTLSHIRSSCSDLRETAIVEWFVNTGCRLSEVVNLRLSEIDFNSNSATVTGKGNKTRTVFFNSYTADVVQKYLESTHEENGDDHLFTSACFPYKGLTRAGLEAVIKKIGDKAGIESSLFPHLFRHTFATNALNNGMELSAISHLMGHSNTGVTECYAKYRNETLQKAYENVFEQNRSLFKLA